MSTLCRGSSLRLDYVLEFGRAEPTGAAVDHAVTVGTQNYQVFKPRGGLAGRMQGQDMMTLGIPIAPGAVGLLEVEPAHFAFQTTVHSEHLVDLFLAQARVTFTA